MKLGGQMMNRITLVVVAAIVGGLSGCMTPAKYVQKGDGTGIVSIPEWSNVWPTNYEDAAINLIKQHVGQYYEIVDRYQVVIGTQNNPRTSSDPSNPGSSSPPKTEYRIVYRRKTLPPAYPIGGPPAALGLRPLPPGAGLGAAPAAPAGGYVGGSLTGAGTVTPSGGMSPFTPSVAPPANPYTVPPAGNPYAVPPAGSPYSAPPAGSPYTAPPPGSPYSYTTPSVSPYAPPGH
jgi:hypothetical protein